MKFRNDPNFVAGDEDYSNILWLLAEADRREVFAAEPQHFDYLDDVNELVARRGVVRGMRVA